MGKMWQNDPWIDKIRAFYLFFKIFFLLLYVCSVCMCVFVCVDAHMWEYCCTCVLSVDTIGQHRVSSTLNPEPSDWRSLGSTACPILGMRPSHLCHWFRSRRRLLPNFMWALSSKLLTLCITLFILKELDTNVSRLSYIRGQILLIQVKY